MGCVLVCSTCHSSSFIQKLPKVCSSCRERQEPQRVGPIRQARLKPLFRAYLHISLARSRQVSRSNVSGVGNTLLSCGWWERDLPQSFIVSAFALFLLIARPLEGVCLHMGVPSSSPPVLPSISSSGFCHNHSTLVKAPLVKVTNTVHIVKANDVFLPSSYFLLRSAAFHPGSCSLLPELLSLWEFMAPLGPGFTLPP